MRGYRRRSSASYSVTKPKTKTKTIAVKEVPVIDVFIAAVIANRTNGNKLYKDITNIYKEDGYTVDHVVEPNKLLIRRLLNTDNYETEFTDTDRNEGDAVRAYWRMKMFAILCGNASDYTKTCVETANLETIKVNDFARIGIIASMPEGMKRGVVRDIQLEIKQDAQLISSHFGTVGDKISGTVKVLDSFYSEKWMSYYVTGSIGNNMVMWPSKQKFTIGTEYQISGRIKRHRDNNVTQLNYVKIK